MAQKIVVYWRDIPSQVIIKKGRAKGKHVLSERFQEAIDKAAMRAGMAKTDAYVEQWRRETSDCAADEDIQVQAEAVAQEYEAQFSDELLNKMISNKGLVLET